MWPSQIGDNFVFWPTAVGCQDDVFGNVTSLCARQEKEISVSSRASGPAQRRPSPYCSRGITELFLRRLNQTGRGADHPHLVPSLRIKGHMSALVPYNVTACTERILLWRTYTGLCLDRLSGLTLMIPNKMEENNDITNYVNDIKLFMIPYV